VAGFIVFVALIIGVYLGIRFFIKVITYRPESHPNREPTVVPKPPESDPPLINDLADEEAEPPPEPAGKPSRKPAAPKPYRPRFDLEVVGEHYYQKNLKMLAGNHWPDKAKVDCTATLIPETFNIHDFSAVRVEIGGVQVGHLSKANARLFREWLIKKGIKGQPYELAARISGGYDRGDRWMEYSVWLDANAFK
jgi:hypothetical protein